MNLIDYLNYQQKVISTYKNPLLYWGVISGLIKSGEYKLKLYNHNQFYIRPGQGDIYLINDVYLFKEYERVLKYLKPKNNIIIDIGAHIGTVSVLLKNVAKQIFAYEPDPDTYQQLAKNIKLNNSKNIKIFPFAVSEKSGEVNWFRSQAGSGGNSIISQQKTNTQSGTVKSTTLERIIKSHKLTKIDLIKLDCEGAEFQILVNLKNKYYDMVDSIVLEYHNHLSQNYNHKDLVKLLKKRGYHTKIIKVISQDKGIIFATKLK